MCKVETLTLKPRRHRRLVAIMSGTRKLIEALILSLFSIFRGQETVRIQTSGLFPRPRHLSSTLFQGEDHIECPPEPVRRKCSEHMTWITRLSMWRKMPASTFQLRSERRPAKCVYSQFILQVASRLKMLVSTLLWLREPLGYHR